MQTKFDPQRHHRHSIRLKDYDYASIGAHYVTIVTQGRECLFGEIIDGELHLSQYGEIILKWGNEIPIHFSNVKTGTFVIMPNHVHGIIFITDELDKEVQTMIVNSRSLAQGKPTLGQIIAYFKYQSTKEMNAANNLNVITKFWQRNYYEHIVRNEKELKQKINYILSNPSRWEEDQENPKNKNRQVPSNPAIFINRTGRPCPYRAYASKNSSQPVCRAKSTVER